MEKLRRAKRHSCAQPVTLISFPLAADSPLFVLRRLLQDNACL
jgi:hypothetical protein